MISHSIFIFTDGASKGNPGPGGWGAVIAYSVERSGGSEERVVEIGGREERTTNNRMELIAAIKALEEVSDLLRSSKLQAPSFKLVLYSDSSYVINGITKWVKGWKQKGWVTTQKGEVLNRDLWEKLDALASGLSIKWLQVAGHADTPGNARADEIASAFGEGAKPALFDGPKDEYSRDLSRIGARTKESKSGPAFSYVSLVDGVVQVHKTWNECKQQVEGKKARYRKVFSREEEEALVKEFSKG